MYTQFGKSHITDRIGNVPVSSLKLHDHIIILRGEDDVVVNNYKLTEIRYDKIYIFCDINNNFSRTSGIQYHTECDENYLYTYLNGGSLVYLFEDNSLLRYNRDLMDEVECAIYDSCKSRITEYNSFIISNPSKENSNRENSNKNNLSKDTSESIDEIAINYIVIPLNSQNFMCLLKIFTYNGSTQSNDYVLFGEYVDGSDHGFKTPYKNNFYEFRYKIKQYNCRFSSIFNEIRDSLSIDTTGLDENLFAFDYQLDHYLRDPSAKVNIERAQSTFKRLGMISFFINSIKIILINLI